MNFNIGNFYNTNSYEDIEEFEKLLADKSVDIDKIFDHKLVLDQIYNEKLID